MNILGIDASLARTGWAVIDGTRLVAAGAIPTRPAHSRLRRLVTLRDGLRHVLRQYAPGAVAIEEGFAHRSGTTTAALAQVRAVAMLAAWDVAGVEATLLRPTTVKLAVTGSGAAGKKDVQAAVARILALEAALGEDESDAAAVALAADGYEATRTTTPQKRGKEKKR